MSLKASDLRDKFGSKTQIDDEVKSIMAMIDQDILKAFNDDLKSCAISELPVSFDIVGITPKAAQTWIYSDVIDQLREKGFKTKIHMDKEQGRVWIKTKWHSELDSEALKDMKGNIIDHLANEKDFWED